MFDRLKAMFTGRKNEVEIDLDGLEGSEECAITKAAREKAMARVGVVASSESEVDPLVGLDITIEDDESGELVDPGSNVEPVIIGEDTEGIEAPNSGANVKPERSEGAA